MAQRNRQAGYKDDIEALRRGAKGVADGTVLFPLDKELNDLYIALLRTPRGYKSKGDALSFQMIVDYLESNIPDDNEAVADGYGNLHVFVGRDNDTLFSCHIDSVHRTEDPVKLLTDGDFVFTDGKSQLGADDATGILLMLWMIKCGIPGDYLFHRDEEVGGLGSSWVSQMLPNWVAGHKRAIAFDRRGTTDIIVTQASGKCASSEFALALGAALSAVDNELVMEAEDGIFTDTDNYAHLIPECTNLSVGYYNEHTYHEKQDLNFLSRLATALIQINWDLLPTVRDPEDDGFNGMWWYNSPPAAQQDSDVPTDEMYEQEIRDICAVLKKYDREYAIHLLSVGISSFDVEATCQSINARSGYKT